MNADASQPFALTAEDACRIALGAYSNARRAAVVFGKACSCPSPATGGGAPAMVICLDNAWFVGQWMQAISDKLAADDVTASDYAEIIARWRDDENASEGARFASLDNRGDNASSGGRDAR